MSLEHIELMKKVCAFCNHCMRDHSWTNDDKCYCLVATCRCRDFAYDFAFEDYESFREKVLGE